MKIFRKCSVIVTVAILLCSRLSVYVYASSDAFDFITDDSNKNAKTFQVADSKTRETARSWYALLFKISLVVMVIAIITVGIKLAVCDKQEKAEAKKKLLPILIACCGIFGAVALIGIAYEIGSKISKSF